MRKSHICVQKLPFLARSVKKGFFKLKFFSTNNIKIHCDKQILNLLTFMNNNLSQKPKNSEIGKMVKNEIVPIPKHCGPEEVVQY